MPDTATSDLTLDRYHIAATAEVMERRARILKAEDTFAVFDVKGDLGADQHAAEGIYHNDTRYLSEFRLRVAGGEFLLLGSTVSEDAILAVDLTNPDILADGHIAVPREILHVRRTKQLGQAFCRDELVFQNFGDTTIRLPLTFSFDADFSDIFEVRGMSRARRGLMHPCEARGDSAQFSYTGLDGQYRETRLRFHPAPHRLTDRIAHYDPTLTPGDKFTVELEVNCDTSPAPSSSLRRRKGGAAQRSGAAQISSDNSLFDEWIGRSRSDLEMLTTETRHGPYPYAGIPWFSTPFGRDALVTAMLCLWVDPGLARGVLGYLAAHQATGVDADTDAQPGKILHEVRNGEMAVLKEVPFGRYYGSVDSTPLFVMLGAAYWERTGDIEFIQQIWRNIEAALRWIDEFGDSDGDGFVEYARSSPEGLLNQGWEDSNDSVFHADGTLAAPPIALVEVQAYTYAAKIGAARLASALKLSERAKQLFNEAMDLRERFEYAFWSDDLGSYAIALDGQKKPCLVRSSNAGHALLCGIASKARARKVASALMDDTSFSGWGIRTIADGTARYNPMSYHNGSIWPHDNGLIGLGMGHYDLKTELDRLCSGMFDATISIDLHRLPELFCGFDRRPSIGPTSYPVACSPQAWASATVFGLIAGCLGISFDAEQRQLRFRRPVLPSSVGELRVRGLSLRDSSVDLLFRRHTTDVSVNVLSRVGDLKVTVTI